MKAIGVGTMKERNFETSPLTEKELGLILLGKADDLLVACLRWVAEEMNRRGIDSKSDDLTLAYMKGLEDGKAAK